MRIAVREDVFLSPFLWEDADACVRLLHDAQIHHNTLRIPYPYARADAERFLAISAEAARAYGHPVHFAIRRGRQLIGGCGFDDLAHGHCAEIGYWLARTHWGQGIMTDVVRAACKHAQSDWKLVRISALVFTFNRASARVLEKCGFQFEGLLRKHRNKNGQFLDTRLYALVSD